MHAYNKTAPAGPQSSLSVDNRGTSSPRRMVPAVAKAVRLLSTLAKAREPLSLSALAKTLALPKSTIHELCATLMSAGLVRRYETGAYHLGAFVMDLSYAFLARTDAISEFNKLSSSPLLPDETIVLSILDGADVVYLACRNGSRGMGLGFRIGLRLPANTTATGKAQLSTLPEERVIELAQAGGLRRLTKKSITKVAPFLQDLAQVRKRGYSVDDEETGDGTMCLGAPVFGPGSDHAVAGVAISFLKAAIDKHKRSVYSQAVRDLAATVSNRLGVPGLSPNLLE